MKTKKTISFQPSVDMKQLTLARLRAIPKEFQISIGGGESVTRDEAIESVLEDSKLGKELIDIQIDFLRDMAEGKIYES